MAGAAPAATAVPPDIQAQIDERMMRHALTLARRGLGNTWPNPAVGAVVWRMTENGPIVVGRGFTQPGGRPHAEPVALAMAGEAARGASMAVTLEPCSHHGKTPPCVDAVIASGVARVVSAIEDPDPRVNGRGHIHLRAHGVEVVVGPLAREARQLNLGFIRRMVDGRPSVTVKLARTADGFAGRHGERLLITGETANARVHMMRAMADVVLTGVGTVLADDPLLTCRLPGLEARSPVRAVLDTQLRTPLDSSLVRGVAETPVWIFCAEDAPRDREAALAKAGVGVERVARSAPGGPVDLKAALARLAKLGVTRVLCEAGPTLAEAFARAGLLDTIALLTGPEPLGAAGLPALGPTLAALVADREQFDLWRTQCLGRDRLDLFTRRH
ncbi:bifunctional diaminohydroxyphosphoribosylaminopyrimidine deaminase/5-amino-6-(5-phosphoribosylamino)uracil reductase RibD [Alsobacter sp. SYSU M60028]|uniref:Riboflavin biosynthesis protein RibD n=1 Tax=Alsobacter ponti TaxID=2962936 RepID=A0ABT1LA48_9HYPH|nr:bifunctional diaminohydroxyphosphoribosylaminopyrimidine deaminase/5-amino-6-(5-phosphoribosylamino)uracil reductase RibD [Alsobacter ponti]MCP8938356.1 bifunctional diaminohydroxyphosphoribosylaminopyrimidine deaminase/5-amino-6-(5-phosphoribosylamino)uracil reductase RibD [Alsobacter ponti]